MTTTPTEQAELTDSEILQVASNLFPMWREDIQPAFVVRVSRGVIAALEAKEALTTPPAAPADESLNPDYLSAGQLSAGELAALKTRIDTATMPLSPRALADYVSKAVAANDGEPFDDVEIWAIVIEACAETGAAPPQAEPQGPWLDDEGRAMIVNSHHYTAANIKAVVDELHRLEDPQQSQITDLEDMDWRTWCGTLARIITGLAHDVPVAQAEPPNLQRTAMGWHDRALAAEHALRLVTHWAIGAGVPREKIAAIPHMPVQAEPPKPVDEETAWIESLQPDAQPDLSSWGNKEFGRVHDEFLRNTGHAPSMLDMWMIGAGKMDTSGFGIPGPALTQLRELRVAQAIDKLWENAGHGARREDIEAAFRTGAATNGRGT